MIDDHGYMEVIATKEVDGITTATYLCPTCGRVVSFGITGEFKVIEPGNQEVRHKSRMTLPGLGLDLGEPVLDDDVWGEFFKELFGGSNDLG